VEEVLLFWGFEVGEETPCCWRLFDERPGGGPFGAPLVEEEEGGGKTPEDDVFCGGGIFGPVPTGLLLNVPEAFRFVGAIGEGATFIILWEEFKLLLLVLVPGVGCCFVGGSLVGGGANPPYVAEAPKFPGAPPDVAGGRLLFFGVEEPLPGGTGIFGGGALGPPPKDGPLPLAYTPLAEGGSLAGGAAIDLKIVMFFFFF
jgi:hypothetical protein